MKSFTDLAQSEQLAEILPLKSADMLYTPLGNNYPWVWHEEVKLLEKNATPCWSVAALLEVIPQEIFDGKYVINITEGLNNRWVLTYDHFENRNHSDYSLSIGADNLVDACVEMIVKLHELYLL